MKSCLHWIILFYLSKNIWTQTLISVTLELVSHLKPKRKKLLEIKVKCQWNFIAHIAECPVKNTTTHWTLEPLLTTKCTFHVYSSLNIYSVAAPKIIRLLLSMRDVWETLFVLNTKYLIGIYNSLQLNCLM